MKPKIKYDVNVLGMKKKKNKIPAEYNADFRLEKTCIFCT